MRKKLWIPLVAGIVLFVIAISQYPKLYVATGYGAKCMATGIFVAGREARNIQENDLDYSFVKYTNSKINYTEKSVITSFYGLAAQKAVYREGYGCYLAGESSGNVSMSGHSLPSVTDEQSWKKLWPEGDAKFDSIIPGLDLNKLQVALDNAFDLPGIKEKRTAAIVIAYKGKLVAEQYWKEQSINAETRLAGWSMNKSIVNAMVGILVKDGKLALHASAPVVEWLKDNRKDITISDLLQMSSGLKWNEDYGDISDVTTMLYRESDSYRFAIGFPAEKQPGALWKYSSGTANILSGIVRRAFNNDQQYISFPYTRIFRKIGMNSMIMEADASGNLVGSSFGYATARDWARFGQLFLQNGVWQGDSILPRGWVDYSRTPAKASNGVYGACFWLNRSKSLPAAPDDLYACEGHRGQRVFILPSRNLVIVRLGFAEDKFNHNEFIKAVLATFKMPSQELPR